MAPATHALLITGSPGVGKTTLVKKAVQALAGRNLAGFYTEEIRAGKAREGFALVTLRGERFIMAHTGHRSPHRVGRYGVDVQVIDTAVELTLSRGRGAELFVIDEIGKMECFSPFFVKKVTDLLDSGKPVVATIARKGRGFISQVKNREGVELWEVTRENRDEMAGRVVAWVGERLPRRT